MLRERPLDPANRIATRTGLSNPTVYAALAALERIGVVRELTGRDRHRVFAYDDYLRILSEGTEPVAPRRGGRE